MSEKIIMNLNKEIAEKASRIEKERAELRTLIIENPNYFGIFSEVKIKPILAFSVPWCSDFHYDESHVCQDGGVDGKTF